MSGPQIFDMEQGSPEWFEARRGIPTASELQCVLSPRAGKEGKGRQTYMRKLAGEIITGEPAESYGNGAMERGKIMEEEARNRFAMRYPKAEIRRVGFVRNGDKGCSPDSLIGNNAGLEIKTQAPHLLIETLMKDEMPPEFRAQVQGCMWIAERDSWHVVIYYRGMPMWERQVGRDDGYIATLAGAVREFNEELAALVERIRAYG